MLQQNTQKLCSGSDCGCDGQTHLLPLKKSRYWCSLESRGEELGIIIMFLKLLEESTWSQAHVDVSETFV